MSQSNHGMKTLVDRMGEAASNLLAALAPDQRAKALIDFDDENTRTFWTFVPLARKGLPLGEMDYPQRRLAHKLVAAGLSRSAYVTASTIIGLETTLDAIEGWTRSHERSNGRDPGNYYISLFDTPDAVKPWGWKFEGHHISLNYTIAGGQIISPTPTFFGANPAETALNGVATLRPLGAIEDLARALVHALDEEQRARAVLLPVAPDDIVTLWAPAVHEAPHVPERLAAIGQAQYDTIRYTATPKGLAGAAMKNGQQEMLHTLIFEYINRMPDELAAIEAARFEQSGLDDVHLVWAGGLERHQPHYYRLQGPRFLVEYDNTQNDANHIHSVWRDPENDFGAHLLAHHYHTAH